MATNHVITFFHRPINHALSDQVINRDMDIITVPFAEPWPDPSALQQHPLYGATLRSLGGTVKTIGLRHSGDTLAQAQVITRRFAPFSQLSLISRGPLWLANTTAKTRAEALGHILRATSPNALSATVCNAETPVHDALCRDAGMLRLITPQHIAEIDLTSDGPTRRAAMHGKWRNRLAHAENAGLKISRTTMPDDPNHWLLRAEATQRRRRGYSALPDHFTLAYARLHPHQTALFTASHNGTVMAAMLFLLHPPGATYHIGHTSDRGRDRSAHNLILWQATQWLANQGIKQLDLGIVDTQAASGLARFKLGSGARLRSLGATWLYFPPIAALARANIRAPALIARKTR